MAQELIPAYNSEKLQVKQVQPQTPVTMPKVRLERGKYGIKLDIVREGNFFQQIVQRISPTELHPLPLDQVFLFSFFAIGFWKADYAVLIRVLHTTSFQTETMGTIENAYHFYGIDGNTKAIPLGVARHPSSIQAYLRSREIVIDNWHPIHELPDHLAESTSWTGFTTHACLLKMRRENSQIVLVQGE
jgi:hypothetical protein